MEDLLAFAPELDERPILPIRALPGLAFTATPEEIRALASRAGVAYVELDALVPVHLPTATTATRAASVWSGADVLLDAGGRVVDGSGVGVAVIDTGADADNPAIAASIVHNVKVVGPRQITRDLAGIFLDDPPADLLPELFVPMSDTDVGGGHGTHVVGIVAANGPDGRVGAAPGASVYAFGTGAGLSLVTSSIAASWDWILRNHDAVTPPIRIVSNSYGNVGPHNPESAVAILSTRAIGEGLVVVWAAGNGDTLNDGGTGADDRTTGHSKNPTPGSISVANYDDSNTGTRAGQLDSSSSRGLASDPSTWPDLSAPGADILSTRAKTDPLVLLSLPVVEPDGNVFGNALNQLDADVRFRFGGASSPTGAFEFIIFNKPTLVYNAHEGRFAAGSQSGLLVGQDPSAAQNVRYYAAAGAPVGPLRARSDSLADVAPGDHIEIVKNSGTAQAPSMLVIAPDGRFAEVVVRLPCSSGCSAELDLAALFPGAPADGTWWLSVGRTVRPDRVLDPDEGGWITQSGTSMATPHVAGVVALMLQADPSLTPAEVETILETTAHEFVFGGPYVPDPAHPGGTSSFDKGHGLLDARAAVLAALA